jgi:hypothetical protein
MWLTRLFHGHYGDAKRIVLFPKRLRSILSTSFLPLLLSFTLLLNAIGYYPLFKIRQWQVHEEMKTQIRSALTKDQLQCLAFNTENQQNIHWEWDWEGQKEFTYQGKRYDVVRTNTVNKTTYYYCIQDTQEEQLFAQLDEEVEREMEDQKNPLQQTAKKMMKVFSSLLFTPADPLLTSSLLTAQQFVDFHKGLYRYDFLNIISPPPEYTA